MAEEDEGKQRLLSHSSSTDETLHEFGVLKQWQTSVMAPNPLRHVRQSSFPLTILDWIERAPLWKLAVNPEHGLFAVVKQGGELEIRAVDDPEHIITHTKLLHDANADWCRFEWSASSLLLYFARSQPVVDVMDASGSWCYSIPLEGDMEVSFDPSLAVCALESVRQPAESKWSDQLYVLQYCAMLRVYLTGRLSGYHPCYSVDLSLISSGLDFASCLTVCVDQSLLYITAQYPKLTENEWCSVPSELSASRLGVLQLRLTTEQPFAVLTPASQRVADQLNTTQGGLLTRTMSWMPCCGDLGKSEMVVSDVNPTHSRLACVSSAGDLFVFDLPSLNILAAIEGQQLVQKSKGQDVLDCRPCVVRWWTENELMTLKYDGTLCLLPVEAERAANEQRLLNALRHEQLSNKRVLTSTAMLAPDTGLCYLFECITEHGSDVVVTTPSKLRLAAQLFGVTFYGWMKMLVGATVGQPSTEVRVPTADTVAKRQVRFRLSEMRLTTPDEMFRKMLDGCSYLEALQLAKNYELDTDEVHKRRWAVECAKGVLPQLIDECLTNVSDMGWVLHECLQRTAPQPRVCQQLLRAGLDRTRKELARPGLMQDQNRAQSVLRVHVRLLHYECVLNSCVQLARALGTPFASDTYERLRQHSLLQCAMHFAQSCAFERLLHFCRRHRRLLSAYWLCLLSAVPEVVHVDQYAPLLPEMNNGTAAWCKALDADETSGWADDDDDDDSRDAAAFDRDPLEQESFQNATLQQWFNDQLPAYRTDSIAMQTQPAVHQFVISSPNTLDTPLCTRWLRWRLDQIEARTGVPDLMLAFIDAAISRGFQSFSVERADVQMYADFVYDVCDTSRSLDEFVRADALYIVTLWMDELAKTYSLDEQIRRGLFGRVFGYLLLWGDRERCQPAQVFQKFVVGKSKENLRFVRKLLQLVAERADYGRVGDQLKYTDDDWLALVDACIGACELTGEELADQAAKVLTELPDACDVSVLSAQLDALSLLDSHDVRLSRAQLAEAQHNTTCAHQLIDKIIRRPSQQQEQPWTLHAWQQLYSDVCALCRLVLHNVTVHSAKCLFVNALLCSAHTQGIQYAAQFITLDPQHEDEWDDETLKANTQSRLSYAVSLSLLIAAAVEYINAAANAADPALKFAQQCLVMVDGEIPEVQVELDLIAALPLLEKLGVKELPLKIRILEDKMVLLEQAIASGNKAYAQPKRLLEAADLLHIADGRARVLQACVRQALAHNDAHNALAFAKQLVNMQCEDAWRVCYEVCTSGVLEQNTDNFEGEQQVWAWVLLHCDVGQLARLQCRLDARRARMIALQHAYAGRHTRDVLARVRKLWQEDTSSQTQPRQPHTFFIGRCLSALPPQSAEFEPDNEPYVEAAATLRWLVCRPDVSDHEAVVQAVYLLGACAGQSELSLAALLQLPDAAQTVADTRRCFAGAIDQQHDKASAKQASALFTYFACLVLLSRLHLVGHVYQLADVPPKQLTKAVLHRDWSQLDDKQRRLVADWLDVLNASAQADKVDSQLRQVLAKFPDVNPTRFANEEDYRTDTILGMAMTHDTEAFGVSLRMASEYGVDEWQLRMTNLTYLFTESGLPAQSVQNTIRRHALIEHLIKNRAQLLAELDRDVRPLLNGRDHQLLSVYYLIVHKINPKCEAGDKAQRHRAAVRQLSKLLPNADYFALLGSSSLTRLVDLTHRQLQTAERALAFAGLWSAVPDLAFDYSLPDYCRVFARRLFDDVIDSTEADGGRAAVDACALLFDQLEDKHMQQFIDELNLNDMLAEDRQSTVQALIAYLQANSQRLAASLAICTELASMDADRVLPAPVKEQDDGNVTDSQNVSHRLQRRTPSPSRSVAEPEVSGWAADFDEPAKPSVPVLEENTGSRENVSLPTTAKRTKKPTAKKNPKMAAQAKKKLSADAQLSESEIKGESVETPDVVKKMEAEPANRSRQSTGSSSIAGNTAAGLGSPESTQNTSGYLSSLLGLTSPPSAAASPLQLYRRDETSPASQSSAGGGGWGFDYGSLFSAVKQQIAPPEDTAKTDTAHEPSAQQHQQPEPAAAPKQTTAPSRLSASPPPTSLDTGSGLVHRRKK